MAATWNSSAWSFIRMVMAGCDTPPVLEFAEHVLDFNGAVMALFAGVSVICDPHLPVFPWWNTGPDASVFQGIPEPVRIISAIRGKMPGGWRGIKRQPRAFVIARPAAMARTLTVATGTIDGGQRQCGGLGDHGIPMDSTEVLGYNVARLMEVNTGG